MSNKTPKVQIASNLKKKRERITRNGDVVEIPTPGQK